MDIQAKVQQQIARPVAEVFEAIVNPEKMTQYFISAATGPIQQDKIITWTFADAGVDVTINIKQVEKDKLIIFEWPASSLNTRVEIKLEAVNENSTRVTATETGWEMNSEGVKRALQQTEGWTHMLLCMKAYLEFGINLRRGIQA